MAFLHDQLFDSFLDAHTLIPTQFPRAVLFHLEGKYIN